jgi:hypothetical protein
VKFDDWFNSCSVIDSALVIVPSDCMIAFHAVNDEDLRETQHTCDGLLIRLDCAEKGMSYIYTLCLQLGSEIWRMLLCASISIFDAPFEPDP